MDLFLAIIKYLLLGIVIIGPIWAIILFIRIYKNKKWLDWYQNLDFVLLRLLVPKNNEKTPLAAEQMFAAMHGIYKLGIPFQDYLSFELASRDKYLQFYVFVPRNIKDYVEGQIYAQYPIVEIEEVEDYAKDALLELRSKNLQVAGCELVLTRPDINPIKTFPNFEVDPLAGITGVLSKVDIDEKVFIQVLAEPVSDEWQKKVASLTGKGGGGFGKTILSGGLSFFGELLAEAFGHNVKPKEEKKKEEKKKEYKEEEGKEKPPQSVEQKISKLGFRVLIRIVAIAPDSVIAQSKVAGVVGAFKQYNLLTMNGFAATPIVLEPSILALYASRYFPQRAGYMLNIEEVASIFHLPNISVETPSIVWAGSKKGEPPSNLPIEENVESLDLTVFAKTNFRHIIHKFGIKTSDRRLHIYAIGKTGTGKTTMLENMIIDDIREGRGVAVVDPHGDLIKRILNFIPNERINDVIVFSPADREYPVAFNPLEAVDPEMKNIIASGVVGIFKKIFGESWGPRLEYILRNTILALLDYPNATMLGIMRILVDKTYRRKVVEQIKDPVIRDFFVHEYEAYDQKFRTEAIAPIQNKVGQFLSSSLIRNIVGQPKSTINLEEAMNTGKIILLDLSIGKIGEDNSALLGSMIITKIQLAAMSRATIPEEQRRDFYLYVDEFQNFATDSFATILSEARKYRLSIIMTNQYIAQMPELVSDAVFGNVGTIISFRVGSADSDFLQKEFEPVFVANDLVNLDNYHVYIKMAIEGVTCPAFSAITLPPAIGTTENVEKVTKLSRERYGRKREEVERMIQESSEYIGPTINTPLNNVVDGEAVFKKPAVPQVAKIGERVWEKYDSHGQTWYSEASSENQPALQKEESSKSETTTKEEVPPKSPQPPQDNNIQMLDEGKITKIE